MTDREAAAQWARAILNNPDVVLLDSETTGLDTIDEAVSVAIIDTTGAVLLDTLIKPSRAISAGAAQIHGLSAAQLADAPTFDLVYPQILDLLRGKVVVIYNAAYDRRILVASAAGAGGAYLTDISAWWDRYTAAEAELDATPARWECAMERYSEWYGDWSSYHQSYKWQRLPGGDHSALGDCRACLAVIKRMAGFVTITTDDDRTGVSEP